jgi:hypothetical protein
MDIDIMINSVFGHDVPISGTVYRRWEKADKRELLSAFRKVEAHKANLWAFGADERHFEQFADTHDKAALVALTQAEAVALLGNN